jgi:copper chaperone CopZ
VRVAVEKIQGVEEVSVSLNNGVAVVRLAPDNRVTVAQLRRVIREKGFTPRDAEVRVAGRLEARGNALVLVLPDVAAYTLRTDQTFRAELQSYLGTEVAVEGRVPEDGEGNVTPMILEAKSVARRPPSG